jgi:hypothetical protein
MLNSDAIQGRSQIVIEEDQAPVILIINDRAGSPQISLLEGLFS